MNISFIRQYRKRETGKIVFVYKVNGTPEELASYKTSKGAFYKEDPKEGVLFFTPRYVGPTCLMREYKDSANITQWAPDTSKLDQIASLAQQFGSEGAKAISKTDLAIEPAQN